MAEAGAPAPHATPPRRRTPPLLLLLALLVAAALLAKAVALAQHGKQRGAWTATSARPPDAAQQAPLRTAMRRTAATMPHPLIRRGAKPAIPGPNTHAADQSQASRLALGAASRLALGAAKTLSVAPRPEPRRVQRAAAAAATVAVTAPRTAAAPSARAPRQSPPPLAVTKAQLPVVAGTQHAEPTRSRGTATLARANEPPRAAAATGHQADPACRLGDGSCRDRVCSAQPRGDLPPFRDVGIEHRLGSLLPATLRYEDVFLSRDTDKRQPVPFIEQMRTDLPPNATRFFYRPHLGHLTATGRFRRCAVVGNGGYLTQRNYGPEIDQHSLVFRVNQAPTQGYERHVGKRTTHRLLNHEWSHKEHGYGSLQFIQKKQLPIEKDAVFLLSRNVGREVVSNLKKVRQAVSKASPHAGVSVLNSLVVRAARNVLGDWRSCAMKAKTRFVGGSSPSSGIVAVLMSMWVCERVSVYGIGGLEGVPQSERKNLPYQYYALHGTQRLTGNPTHSFAAEASLVHAWAKSGLLRQCGLKGCIGGGGGKRRRQRRRGR